VDQVVAILDPTRSLIKGPAHSARAEYEYLTSTTTLNSFLPSNTSTTNAHANSTITNTTPPSTFTATTHNISNNNIAGGNAMLKESHAHQNTSIATTPPPSTNPVIETPELKSTPLLKFETPKDLGSLYAFVTEEGSRWITGRARIEPLIVDDNTTMWGPQSQDNIIVSK